VPGFIDAHTHPRPLFDEDSPWYNVEAGPAKVKTIDDLIAAIRRNGGLDHRFGHCTSVPAGDGLVSQELATWLVLTRPRKEAETKIEARVRLVLVGAGPEEELLRRAQLPGVLAGEQHGLALSRWYASADVFGFPSLSETFGNVVLEARASGLPVVGFDCQGVNERVAPGGGRPAGARGWRPGARVGKAVRRPRLAPALRPGGAGQGGAAGLGADLRRIGGALPLAGRARRSTSFPGWRERVGGPSGGTAQKMRAGRPAGW
jgi:hypothetical protein